MCIRDRTKGEAEQVRVEAWQKLMMEGNEITSFPISCQSHMSVTLNPLPPSDSTLSCSPTIQTALLAAVAKETGGKLHVLINNAGTNWAEPIESYPLHVRGEARNEAGTGGSEAQVTPVIHSPFFSFPCRRSTKSWPLI